MTEEPDFLVDDSQLAIIKLIVTGAASKKACQNIHPAIVGLDFLSDDAEVLTGNQERISRVIEGVDLLFVVVSVGHSDEVRLAIEIALAARKLGLFFIMVTLFPAGTEDDSNTDISVNLSALKASTEALLIVSTTPFAYAENKNQSEVGLDSPVVAAVRSITELITRSGMMGIDFRDVMVVMTVAGMARLGQGSAAGDKRAIEATDQAISNLIINQVELKEVETILINISTGLDGSFAGSLAELDDVVCAVREVCSDAATLVIGMPVVPELGDELRVTVLATGITQLG